MVWLRWVVSTFGSVEHKKLALLDFDFKMKKFL